MHIWKPICEFIIKTKYEELPVDVISQAKLTLLDTLGAMLAGSQVMPIPNMVKSCFKGGINPVTIVGHSVFMEPNSAALINGTSAVALEIDEGNQFAKGHPASHVVPAALAWAEHIGASGKQLLESLVVGYELAARIGAATTLRDEVHPHGTWGTIGAAVAVAKLRGFSLQEVSRTIHLAAAMSSASAWSTALSGGTIRNVYTGLSNHLGMLAVDLARAGVNTGDGIVEIIFSSILGTDFDSQSLNRNLGTSFFITNNYFKMHACCRYNHAALDAFQSILAQQPVSDDRIMKIEVETYKVAARLKNQHPLNMLAAKFSIPFALATYIVNGNAGVHSFSEVALANERINKLAQKVNVYENPSLTAMLPDKRPARVTLHLKDGRLLSQTVASALGNFDTPYPTSQIVNKFRQLAGEVVGASATEKLIALCLNIEEMDNIATLSALLSPK